MLGPESPRMRGPNARHPCRHLFLILVAVFGCGGSRGAQRPVRQRVLPADAESRPASQHRVVHVLGGERQGNLHQFATSASRSMCSRRRAASRCASFHRRIRRASSPRCRHQRLPRGFFGHLKISNVKPTWADGRLSPVLRATVTVDLSVWLVNTRTGGTMWRRSSSSTEEVGGLSFIGGTPSFSATDRTMPTDA